MARADPVHTEVVERACRLLGPAPLANLLRVSSAMVETWLAGTASTPPRMLFRMVRLLQHRDPAFRPFLAQRLEEDR